MGGDLSQEGEQAVEAGKCPNHGGGEGDGAVNRREKRKAMKKQKRKKMRKEAAIKEKEEEEALANDPEEQLRARLREQEEAAVAERATKEFEERERLWIEAAEARRRKALEEKEKEEEEEAEKNKLLEEGSRQQQKEDVEDNDTDWEYVEEGPAEIIWKENEIIVKKKRVKIPKRSVSQRPNNQEDDRPTSNPLPPQSAPFASFKSEPPLSAQELLESVAQQTPNFGTEQDKTHCPFHLKTGVCRFGSRCNRTHFYPDKSCTLLIKSMYAGPGLVWEQDEGLEYTDEEIERSFEEFYEDVHTEFLKFGEIVNFKVCRNGSFHLRGNVYVHYKNLESAVLAHSAINGRYFAGKQIACEFIGVTRWKVAICGEYMKSRLKTCSRGTACNFIHCFRNPGGEYEWADWDNPPPKYWVKKMTLLFGTLDKFESSNILDVDDRDFHEKYRGRKTHTSGRSYRGSRHSKGNFHDFVSEKDELDKYRGHRTSQTKRNHSGRRRSRSNSTNEWEKYEEKDWSNLDHLEARYSSHHYSPREDEHGEKRSRAFVNGVESKEEYCRESESHRKHRRHYLNRHTRWGCFSEEHDEAGSVSKNHEYHDTDWGFDKEHEDACGGGNITYSAEATSSSHTSDNSSGCDRTQRSVDRTLGGGHSLASKVNYRDLVKDRKHQEYGPRNHSGYVSDDHIHGSENKSRRRRGRNRSVSSGVSLGDLKDSMDRNKGTVLGKVPSTSCHGSWSVLEESVDHSRMSGDGQHGNEEKHSGYSKRKRHRKKRRTREDSERPDGHPDSADLDLRKDEYTKCSRRLTPSRHANSSKKKDRHNDHEL